jgi:hypothetical protein
MVPLVMIGFGPAVSGELAVIEVTVPLPLAA